METVVQNTLWEKYGKQIIMGVVVLIIAYAGVQYYFHVQQNKSLEASMRYDKVVALLEEGKTTEAQTELQALMEQKTAYASVSALILARLSVEQRDWDRAEEQLTFVIDKEKKGALQEFAKVRLARVLIEQREYTKALALLDTQDVSENFRTLFEETRGDLFLLQDRRDEARLAYQLAIKSAVPGSPVERLQLKQVELGIKEE